MICPQIIRDWSDSLNEWELESPSDKFSRDLIRNSMDVSIMRVEKVTLKNTYIPQNGIAW